MAEIYKNIKTGVKAELVEINEKSKQVTLKKLADGKLTSTLMGSFEKYWKKIDGEATIEKKPVKTELKKEVEKPVEEPAKAEEVKKEEPKAEKSKKEKAEKSKKEKRPKNTENVNKILDAIFKYLDKKSGCDVGVPREESMKFRALRINGRQFCKLMWSDKSVRLYFRCDEIKNISDKVQHANYSLSNLYIVTEFNDAEISNIKQMFDVSIDYEIKRKEKEKAEKSEKKETKKSEKLETEEK